MDTLATAFVRILPDTREFKEKLAVDTREAVAETRRSFAKMALGLFAIGGAAEFIRETGKAASSHQQAMAQIQQSIKATGGAWNVAGSTVGATLEEMARKSGFTFAELSEGFGRLEVQNKNSQLSIRDLALAEDIARGRHIQLAQAATVLARAEGGSFQSLSRLGIIIPKVTDNQALYAQRLVEAKKHLADFNAEQAREAAAGVKHTTAQNVAILQQRTQLAQGVAAVAGSKAQATESDKLASKQQILGEIQKRYGGQVEAYSKTAVGAQQRFKVAVEELEASIGEKLAPSLANAFTALSRWADELQHSKRFQDDWDQTVQTGGELLGGVRDVLVTIAPAAEDTANALSAIVGAVGGAPLIAAAAAYKGMAIAMGIVAAAKGRIAAASAQEVASTQATVAANAEASASYDALAASATAAAGAEGAAGAGGGVAALGAEAATASEGVGLLSTAAAALGGSAVLLPAALAVGVGAIIYLGIQASKSSGAVHDLQTHLDDLAQARHEHAAATGDVANAERNLQAAKRAREEAATGILQARQQLTQDKAQHATRLQLRVDTDNLRAATARWRDANSGVVSSTTSLAASFQKQQAATVKAQVTAGKLADDLYYVGKQAASTADLTQTYVQRQALATETTKRFNAAIAAGATPSQQLYDKIRAQVQAQQDDATSSTAAAKAMGDYADAHAKTSPVLARNARLVVDFIQKTHQVPNQAVTEFLIDHGSADKSFTSLFAKLEAWAKAHPKAVPTLDDSRIFQQLASLVDASSEAGRAIAANLANATAAATSFHHPDSGTAAQVTASRRADAAAKQRAADLRNQAAKDRQQASKDAAALRDAAVTGGSGASGASGPSAAQTAASIAKQVADATAQAKQNLTGFASTLSGMVGQVIDQVAAKASAQLQHGPIAQAIASIQHQLDKLAKERAARDAAEQLAQAQRDAARAVADQPLAAKTAQDQLAQAQQQLALLQAHPAPAAQQLDYQLQLDQAQAAVVTAQRAVEDLPTQAQQAQQQAQDAAQAITDAGSTQRQAKLQAELDKRQTAIDTHAQKAKDATTRRIADLTDEFSRGSISLTRFTDGIGAVLKSQHVTLRSAGQVLGVAFADGFRQAVSDLLGQAGLVKGKHVPVPAGSSLIDPAAVGAQARASARAARASAAGSVSLPTASAGGGNLSATGAQVVSLLQSQVGVPYSYGAESAGHAFDCSGLVQWVMGRMGVSVGRTTQAQARQGKAVAANDLRPGDCIYFTVSSDSGPPPQHVAIYIGGGQAIHAPHTGASVSIVPLASFPYPVYTVRRFLTTSTVAAAGTSLAAAAGAGGKGHTYSAAASVSAASSVLSAVSSSSTRNVRGSGGGVLGSGGGGAGFPNVVPGRYVNIEQLIIAGGNDPAATAKAVQKRLDQTAKQG